jgi:hypothetical protein
MSKKQTNTTEQKQKQTNKQTNTTKQKQTNKSLSKVKLTISILINVLFW